MGLITFLFILVLKSYQIVNMDIFTMVHNYREKKLQPHNRNLLKLVLLNHLEFAFFYHVHYQVFSFLYYVKLEPCLAIEKTNNVTMLFDSSYYMIFGESGQFLRYVFFTYILFFVIHCLGTIFYMVHPIQNSQVFYNPLHIVFRLISYIVGVWVVSRIGAFLVY